MVKRPRILIDSTGRLDLHTHASFSDDGTCSPEELVAVGQARMLSVLGVVAHAHRVRPVAAEFVQRMRTLATRLTPDGWVQVGIEADTINVNGRIDLDELESLDLDFVMASMHYLPSRQDRVHSDTRTLPVTQAYDQITQTFVNTLRNPQVDIIGHPFGYIYCNWHIQLPLDCVEKIARAAAEEGVALDMGSQRYRLPCEYELSILRICRSYGVTVYLGSDAHHADQVGQIDYEFYSEFI